MLICIIDFLYTQISKQISKSFISDTLVNNGLKDRKFSYLVRMLVGLIMISFVEK